MKTARITIGVVGGNHISDEMRQLAYDVGKHIAKNNAVLVCGGLGGTMEAASKGAYENGGVVIGVLPGDDKKSANQYVHFALPTGMGAGRNVFVVRFSDVCIAFPGAYGTLSEIAFALDMGKTVISMPGTWELNRIAQIRSTQLKQAFDASQAVGLALNALI